MKKVVAAGVVLYRMNKKGAYEYLLLQHTHGVQHWSFAKGKREGDESLCDCARRELLEETGLKVDLDEDFLARVTYESMDTREGQCKKTAYFFLGHVVGKRVRLSHEHADYVWLPYEKARKRLTHDSMKCVLDKAYSTVTAFAKLRG